MRLKSYTIGFLRLVYAYVLGRASYRVDYDIAELKRSLRRACKTAQETLVLVLPPSEGAGWILDGICKEVCANAQYDCIKVRADESQLPSGSCFFFSHYAFFRDRILKGDLIPGKAVVFFTHPKESFIETDELVFLLKRSNAIISMCRQYANWLQELGVPSSMLYVATIGADPEKFRFHERDTGVVGLCSAYYERKRPDLVLQIVRELAHRRFVLMGRNWSKWKHFEILTKLKNFEYVESAYTNYPEFYRNLDVFLSVSEVEGGPVPLVESMMSNCFPVASAIGTAPDIIVHGENGFLFDNEAPVSQICDLVEKAFAIDINVRDTVSHLTWERFADQVRGILVDTPGDR